MSRRVIFRGGPWNGEHHDVPWPLPPVWRVPELPPLDEIRWRAFDVRDDGELLGKIHEYRLFQRAGRLGRRWFEYRCVPPSRMVVSFGDVLRRHRPARGGSPVL